MASHVSNAILSLTRYVFVDEEGVYKIFINAMKEMEKKEWKLWFFARKNLSFHAKAWLQYLHSFHISRVCSTLM